MPPPAVAVAEDEPAAQVDPCSHKQRDEKPGVKSPGSQEAFESWAHGYCFSSFRALAGRAPGTPFGRRFSRNSIRAVISAGLICLPYAGMLPPPGVPLLTWS